MTWRSSAGARRAEGARVPLTPEPQPSEPLFQVLISCLRFRHRGPCSPFWVSLACRNCRVRVAGPRDCSRAGRPAARPARVEAGRARAGGVRLRPTGAQGGLGGAPEVSWASSKIAPRCVEARTPRHEDVEEPWRIFDYNSFGLGVKRLAVLGGYAFTDFRGNALEGHPNELASLLAATRVADSIRIPICEIIDA
jgi:hypothetical protein